MITCRYFLDPFDAHVLMLKYWYQVARWNTFCVFLVFLDSHTSFKLSWALSLFLHNVFVYIKMYKCTNLNDICSEFKDILGALLTKYVLFIY